MSTEIQNSLARAMSFINRLENAKIWHRLEHVREESLMVLLAIPGERWEVEFFEDGNVEVERFLSPGEIEGSEALEKLFEGLDAD